MPMRMFRSIRNRLATRLTPLLHWMERWANKRWFDYPFGSQPHASKEEYLRLFKEVSKKEYEEIDAYEQISGFAIDMEWLHELALHTQVVIKKSPLCYAHGRVLYTALSRYLAETAARSLTDRITILEIGTARGFSALCMAKALHDQKRVGLIITFDLLPHQVPMFWNCIDDLDGPCTRAELLQTWKDLLQDYVVFHQGDTRLELPKVQTERVHFALIDGAHTYEDVNFEFEQIKERQQSGDMIVYDDYTPQQFPGLVKTVDEICAKHRYSRTDLKAYASRGYVVTTKL